MRLGIVSTADINRKVIPGARASEKVELVAVASRDQQRAEEYARTWEIERAYGSYEALLEDPDVDAVYISLPNTLHREWSIRSLEAGKHVICEKPFSRRVEDVEAAFDAAERTGRLLTEAFMYRHNPQTKRVAELVREGAIGDLRVVRTAFSYSLYDAENIRLRTDVDGGSLMDVGCYCVSGSRLFAGEPETAIGRQVLGPSGVDVRFAATLAFPGEVLAHFDCGLDVPANALLEVVGSRGTLRLPSPFLIAEPAIELLRDEETERIEVSPAGCYRLEFENMSAAIRGTAEPLLDRDDALGQAGTIEALYASAERGGEAVACAEVGRG
jgi:D-xylose 1-dehydrogenase (NADP+, D-xylono-1,5-lactone-forming)